jgi:hypothetical protein
MFEVFDDLSIPSDECEGWKLPSCAQQEMDGAV